MFCISLAKVCLLPEHVLQELVRYALWLLECSHESGRCHATMFFGTSFQFRVILELFDAQDGLRRLYNMISTLSILSLEDQTDMLDDDLAHTARQTVIRPLRFENRLLDGRKFHFRPTGGRF